MKRIFAILKRDVKVARRDFVLLYTIVAPILIALLLSGMAPDVAATSMVFAIDNTLAEHEVEALSKISQIITYESREDVIMRVKDTDDVYGLSKQNGQFEVILEGNEVGDTKSMMNLIVSYLEGDQTSFIDYQVSNINVGLPPIVSIGSASLIIMSIILGGMVMGLNIVEDKEFNTIRALNTSPLGKIQYIIGKSFLGIILPMIHTPAILLIMGINDIALLKLIVIITSSILFVVFAGLLIGMLGSSQLSAIASAKGMMFILAGSVLGAIVLRSSMHVVLYWSPLYWIYQGIYKTITNTANWSYVMLSSSVILGISIVLFLALAKYQKKTQAI